MSILSGLRLLLGRNSQNNSGKLPGRNWRNTNNRRLFDETKITEIDYSENNYDLFRSIYYNSTVNGVGIDYQIAAALGKPIVNIAAGYVLGKGFSVELSNPDGNELISRCEDEINKWIKDNERIFLNIARHSYRDGDAYLHIDEYGGLTECNAEGVEEIIEPITGRTIGFDVSRRVVETDPIGGISRNVVYVRQYRTDSLRIYSYEEGQPDNITVIWERMTTDDGYTVIPREESGLIDSGKVPELVERSLSIIALHNEPEAEAVYGNSDYQNLLSLFANYSGTIKAATKGCKYNAIPTLKISGLTDPARTEYASNSNQSLAEQALDNEAIPSPNDNKRGIEWGSDSVLYLSKDSDANFINGSGFMDDLSKLLEVYFYLFVQGSETPEYVFGTAVSSSKASTDTQSPVFLTKIGRKQLEYQEFVQRVVMAYIDRKAWMSDVAYQELVKLSPSIRVVFPPIDNDDAQLTFSTVQWAYENSLLTSEKALDIVLSNQVKDSPQEVREAALEAKKRAEMQPAASDRIVRDLLSNNEQTQEMFDGDEDVLAEMNPYHDNLGKFASKGTGRTGGGAIENAGIKRFKPAPDVINKLNEGGYDYVYCSKTDEYIAWKKGNRLEPSIFDTSDRGGLDTKSSKEAIEKMTPAQRNALTDYTSEYGNGSYHEVNGYLRGTGFGTPSKETVAKAEEIKTALKNAKLGSETYLYRGADVDMFGDAKLQRAITRIANMVNKSKKNALKTDPQKDIDLIAKQVGTTFVDKGVMSTSPHGGAFMSNRPVKITVRTSKNDSAVSINELSKYSKDEFKGVFGTKIMESEVVYAPGSKFKIVNAQIGNGGVHFMIEQITGE
jgi:hypothetical protein|nr:MAG TPA: PORTAL PROTEIN [Caudoviricetes sp.]